MGPLRAPRATLLPPSLLLLALLAGVHAQFPLKCPPTMVFGSRTRCCPVWSGDGSECGSKSGRGKCVAGPASDPINNDDVRLEYPWEMYSHVCNCTYPYGKFNCGGCTFNRQGPTCSTTCQVERKPVTSMTDAELVKFRNALNKAKHTMSDWCGILVEEGPVGKETFRLIPASTYDCMASAHAFNARFLAGTPYDMIHSGPAFITWHRWYLLYCEQVLQEVSGDCTLGIPYWDWRFSNHTCNICTAKYLGGSMLTNWTSVCENSNSNTYCRMPVDQSQRSVVSREPGRFAQRLPTRQNVKENLRWTVMDVYPYDEYSEKCVRNGLEGNVNSSDGVTTDLAMHNLGHVFIGKDMLSTMTAPSDPIFFLHHCTVDSIADWWMKKNKANPMSYPACNYAGHHPEDYLACAFPLVTNKAMYTPLANFGSSYYYIEPME